MRSTEIIFDFCVNENPSISGNITSLMIKSGILFRISSQPFPLLSREQYYNAILNFESKIGLNLDYLQSIQLYYHELQNYL